METENSTLIEMELHRLDCVACAYEAKWGIGNLYDYATPELRQKWDAQNEKLANAVSAQDYFLVRQLVAGSLRGWELLERSAAENGHAPIEPHFFEVQLESGFTLRIAKNVSEARAITKEGVFVWSLKEVARVIEKDYTLVNVIKQTFPEAAISNVRQKKSIEQDVMPF